jgi:hypothetical protein
VAIQYMQAIGEYDQLVATLDDGLAYYQRAVADGAVSREEIVAHLETLTIIAHRHARHAVEALGRLTEAARVAERQADVVERQAALIQQQQALILAIRAEIGALMARVAQ